MVAIACWEKINGADWFLGTRDLPCSESLFSLNIHIYAKATGVWCGSEADASRQGHAESPGRRLAMSVCAGNLMEAPERFQMGTSHYCFLLCS